MAARRPPSRSLSSPPATAAACIGAVLAVLVAVTACGSSSAPVATEPPPPSIPIVLPSAPATNPASNDTVPPPAGSAPTGGAPTTDLVQITVADVTLASAAPTTASPRPGPATTAAGATPGRLCPGLTALPGGVAIGDRITGNVDGDGTDDTVTAYTGTDGTPHVFLQRGGAGGSDVQLPLGPSNQVSISFENVDYALGAETPPPLVVMAIGMGPAGSAIATFLSPNPAGCLQQWQLNGQPFTFSIDQRGPYSGLLCDGAAGKRYYVLRTATPDGEGNVQTTSLEIQHIGTTVALTRLGDETIPADATVQHLYGDIQNCDHPPLFP